MKTITVVAQMFLLFLAAAGCEPTNTKLSTRKSYDHLSEYRPVKVDIMPLTEFTANEDSENPLGIKVYVSLLDAFDCQIKAPATFRFELYEWVPRSAESKGRRILIWPDIDLNDAAKNNSHWMDFLRTYQFDLPFEPQPNQTYILQITSMCPNGKRISAELTLKHAN